MSILKLSARDRAHLSTQSGASVQGRGVQGRGVLRGVTKAIAISALTLTIAGCTERIRNHGYVPSTDDLSQITVGVDTRATVEEVLGAPSTGGVLNDGGYYYVRTQMRHYAALEPKVVNREIVAVSFDSKGVVTNIETYGLEDGRPVVLSRRVTSDQTKGRSIIQQLFGSLGNVSAENLLN